MSHHSLHGYPLIVNNFKSLGAWETVKDDTTQNVSFKEPVSVCYKLRASVNIHNGSL